MNTNLTLIQISNVTAMSVIALMAGISISSAQDSRAIYRSLSLIEEPLAFELGDVTLTLRGTLEAPIKFDLRGSQPIDYGFASAIQFGAETQLFNSWTLNTSYILGYDTRQDDALDHQYIISLGRPGGNSYFGHVTDVLRMETDRNLSVGNADLAYDNSLASLEDIASGYIGRFGPTQLGAIYNQDLEFDIGGVFQRPLKNHDHRYAVRFTRAEFDAADNTKILGQGVHGVGELVYGSSKFSLGGGFEHLTFNNLYTDRYYLSAGANTKIGPVSGSIEGHIGQIDGQGEYSASVGAAYDFAQGASVNAGLNYKKSDVSTKNVHIHKDDDFTSTLSLRYSF